MNTQEIKQLVHDTVKIQARIIPSNIENLIQEAFYFTAKQGAEKGAEENGLHLRALAKMDSDAIGKLAICVLVLSNGHTVIGEAICASLDPLDVTAGHRLAKLDAINKIWALESYLLKQRLYELR